MIHRVEIYHAGGSLPSLVAPLENYYGARLAVRDRSFIVNANTGADFSGEVDILRPRIGIIGDPRKPLSEAGLKKFKRVLYRLAEDGVNFDAIALDVGRSPLFGLRETKIADNIRAHFALKAAGC